MGTEHRSSMKIRKHNLPLYLLLWCCVCFQKYAHASDELERLDLLFEKGESATNLLGKNEFVVLVGGTGTGKSTLSKFLRKDSSLEIKLNEAEDYVFVDNEVRIGNEDNHRSKTMYPNVDVDDDSNVMLVDLAGFEDTRHPSFDLVTAFFNKKVFDAAQRLKVVVVDNFEHVRLSSQRSAFLTTINHLAHLLQDQVDAFQDSIALVATKVDSSKSDGALVKSVLTFLQATLKSLQTKVEEARVRGESEERKHLDRMLRLVQFLANANRIAVFRRPGESGIPWQIKPMKDNWLRIRDVILSRLNYSSPLTTGKFQVAIAPGTVNYIKENLVKMEEDKLQNDFGIVYEQIEKTFLSREESITLLEQIDENWQFYTNTTSTLKGLDSIDGLLAFCKSAGANESLVSSISFKLRKVKFYNDILMKKNDAFHETVLDMFGQREKLATRIEKLARYSEFLKIMLDFSDSYDVQVKGHDFQLVSTENYKTFIFGLPQKNVSADIVSQIAEIEPSPSQLALLNNLIKERLKNEVQEESSSDATVYKARYLILSHVLQSRSEFHGELILMASSKVFLDVDLHLLDTHLTIVTPLIEVVGPSKRKITLRGSNGARVHGAPAFQGYHGVHGNSGFSSGDVTIIALKVSDANLLEVHSIGGDGSNGQKGGNGRDASVISPPEISNGHWGTYDNVKSYVTRHGYTLSEVNDLSADSGWMILLVYNSVEKTEKLKLRVTNFNRNGPPTNGGNGGNGGSGALAGDQTLILSNEAEYNMTVTKTNGQNGLTGEGGRAGRTGHSCIQRIFYCLGSKNIKYVLVFPINNPSMKYDCRADQIVYCGTYPPANNGRQGNEATISNLQRLKTPAKTSPTKAMLSFSNFIIQNSKVKEGSLVYHFLKFFFTSPGTTSFLTPTEYLRFANELEGASSDENIRNIYSLIYESLKSSANVELSDRLGDVLKIFEQKLNISSADEGLSDYSENIGEVQVE